MTATLNHLAIVKELGQILRHEHSGWRGDGRANGSAFLLRIRRDMPAEAVALADDLHNNQMDFANETGVSPRTILIAAGVLRGEFLSL